MSVLLAGGGDRAESLTKTAKKAQLKVSVPLVARQSSFEATILLPESWYREGLEVRVPFP